MGLLITVTDSLLFNMLPWFGRISGTASSTFGAGGNFLPDRVKRDSSPDVRSLRGKIDGRHPNIRLKGKGEDARVQFRIRERDSLTGNDRSELAVGRLFDGDDTQTIGVSFRVTQKDPLTGFGYFLQIWQPVESPRAGIRLNTSNNSQYDLVSRSGGGVTQRFRPDGKWNHVVMTLNDDSGITWRKRDGSIIARSPGGFLDPSGLEQTWRPKFGYYGQGDKDTNIEFKQFVIGDLASVLEAMG